MKRLMVEVDGDAHPVWLKLESENPSGSIKYRTAAGLLDAVVEAGRLEKGRTVVESTSGNLGAALALLAADNGFNFRAVVDHRVPDRCVAIMEELGAEVDLVAAPPGGGSSLRRRLERVVQLAASPRFVWTNQYRSWANPRAHYRTTAPEIFRQSGGRVDAVFVAVSTGGTLAGIASYFRRFAPRVRLIGVDAAGSVVFVDEPGRRLLTGIGSDQKSAFLSDWMYDEFRLVSDADAFRMCRSLHRRFGVAVGGSSGAALAAWASWVSDGNQARFPVCICADGADRYEDTIFDDLGALRAGAPRPVGAP